MISAAGHPCGNWKRVRVTPRALKCFSAAVLSSRPECAGGSSSLHSQTVANVTSTGTPNANHEATNFRFRKAPTVWRRIRRTKLHIKQQFAISLYIVVVGYNRHVLVTERARRWGIWTHSMVVFFQGRLPQLKNS